MNNTGGRINLQEGSSVRIVDEYGKASSDIYLVRSGRSDRKGHAILELNGVQKKVHYKRILSVDSLGKAIAIELNGRYSAICPECQLVRELESNADNFQCMKHGTKGIVWLGVKPTTSKPQKQRQVKAVKQVIKLKESQNKMKAVPINLAELAKLKDCELYSLRNVKFDHARVEVNANTLLFVGENPRKLCFNTYNGNLGKKASELPIAEFLAGKEDKRWYPVKDLAKAREALEKAGYEKL